MGARVAPSRRRAVRAGARAGLERPPVGRRRRPAGRGRPPRRGRRPARPRPLGQARRRLRHRDLRRRPARAHRRLGLDRPVVAGQSWGGNVVLELAAGTRAVHARSCGRRRVDRLPTRSPTGTTAPRAAAAAAAGRDAARARGLRPRRPTRLARDGIARHAGQLRGPRRRHHPPVAHARPPPARSCATSGSTDPSERYRRVDVPVLLVPADTAASRARQRQARASTRRSTAAAPTSGCTGSPRPTTTSTPSTPTSWPPCCSTGRRRTGSSDDRARVLLRSWARARPRRRW